MPKANCWELMRCGREAGGTRVAELGVCPAFLSDASGGMNGGVRDGRACWTVAGTFCGGTVQGTFAEKLVSCMACRFFCAVCKEEGHDFHLWRDGQVTSVWHLRSQR